MNSTLPAFPDFKSAWRANREHFPIFQYLVLAWFGVWGVTEILVYLVSPMPWQPLWMLIHVAYFVGAAWFEAMLLLMALSISAQQPADWKLALFRPVSVLRYLGLKLIIGVGMIIGLALFIVPGLYVVARLVPALMIILDESETLISAVNRSLDMTDAHSGRLMWLAFVVLVFNLVGAALLGLGLFVTLPLTALVLSDLFRRLNA